MIPLEFQPGSAQFDEPDENTAPISSQSIRKRSFTTRAQDELQLGIDLINADLVGLMKRRCNGLLTDIEEKEFKKKKKELNELELKLKSKKDGQERSKRFREGRRSKLEEACNSNPELKNQLKLRSKRGRPSVEEDQPEFLKQILNIAMHGSAAHEKRQNEVYRTIMTLDDLTAQLNRDGFDVKRSTVYIRLQPKRSSSHQGKRHVSTVPVKLIRAQNDHHSKHPDGFFCTATINRLEEVASLLGPEEVFFLSQDDKCRVPIGLTAANKQAPLLMHLEYRIQLPDHDWVVAAGHKLIPSVYAGN